MQNRRMERSAAWSGIVGAIVLVASAVIPGSFPSIYAPTADIASYIGAHPFLLNLAAWLTLPAVAFVLWFAYGLFDYLRDPSDRDRSLGQWGRGGAVIWAALMIASAALMATAAVRAPGPTASLPMLYIFDLVLFVFAFGAFGAFVFGVAHEARRRNAMPGWLNAFGYLVFIVDVLYTLTIFCPSPDWGLSGYPSYVAPLLSALWILVASIVLLRSVPRTAA